jgi:hypothetical protein
MTPIIVVAVALVVELAIGIAIGYALASRDDDTKRGGHVNLTPAAARGDLHLERP